MSLQQRMMLGATVLGLGLATATPVQAAGAQLATAPVAVVDRSKVVATIHAKNLDATLGVVKDYLPVPIKKEAMVSSLFGEFAGLVSLSAPVDFVVALDAPAAGGAKISDGDGSALAPPLWAFAVGIRNLEEAQQLLQSRGMVTDGKLGWSRLKMPIDGRTFYCLLSTGQPATTGRLSCSKQERDRDAVGPYLARLAPSVETSDLHAELAVNSLVRTYDEPWQRALGMVGMMVPTRLQLGQETFDRAVTDLTQALVAQLQGMSRDLQTVTLDLGLAPAGVELRLAYRMSGQASWWGQADAEAAARPPSGVPPIYWTLPGDVTSASFQLSDPKWARKLLALLAPIGDGFLAHEGLPPADRQAVSDLITKLTDASTAGLVTTVTATGKSDHPATPGARAGEATQLLGGGYYLVSTTGPTAAMAIPWLKALVTTYNRPAIQGYLRTKWKKYELGPALPVLRFDPLPKTVGAGALGVSFSGSFNYLNRGKASAGKPTAPTAPTAVIAHLISVPSDGKVWTAFGVDRPTLLRRLSEQGKLAPEQTLVQHAGLEPLREPGVQAGGFTSLVSLASYLDAALAGFAKRSSESKERTQSAAQLFNMIPHHGEVPMNYLSRSSTVAGGARQTELLLRVPRLVIEDIAAMTMQLALEK